jgi:hypothetical protein
MKTSGLQRAKYATRQEMTSRAAAHNVLRCRGEATMILITTAISVMLFAPFQTNWAGQPQVFTVIGPDLS